MTAMKKYLVPFFALAVLTAAVYGGTLNYPFVFDDHDVITENPAVTSLANIPQFFTGLKMAGESDATGLYRPMVFSSYALNYAFTGLKPFSYRLFDVFLHIVNSFLLYLLIIEMQKSRNKERYPIAILSTALFCVLPVLSQPVIYIAARSVLMMTFFCLTSLVYFIKYKSSGKNYLLALSTVFYACALLTKESSLAFIGVFFLMEWSFNKHEKFHFKSSIISLAPFLTAGTLFMLTRLYFLSKASKTLIAGSYVRHWMVDLSVIPRYIIVILDPWRLCLDHFTPGVRWTDLNLWAGFFIICAYLIIFLITLKKDRLLASLLAWTAIALLPEMILPLPERMVEYRLYLPMAGFTAFFSMAAFNYSTPGRIWNKLWLPVALSMLIVFSTSTFLQTRMWSSPERLWQDAINKYPQNPRAYNNLGTVLIESGRYEDAIILFNRAIELDPNYYDPYNNLGFAYLKSGNYALAKDAIEEALRLNPAMPKAYYNLASIYNLMGEQEKAELFYKKAMFYSHDAIVLK